MNLRKFYLILCSVISIFLFVSGIAVLTYLDIGNPENQSEYFEKILSPFVQEKEAFNVLVLGGDKVAKNTDTIMLVNYKPATSQLNLLSIPRDTKVQIKGASIPKVNAAYPLGGANLAVETVSKFLGVNIKYFVYIDTSSFKKIIDLLGGVEYYIPADMDYDDPLQNLHIHLKKGQQHLNGNQAEQLMRFRQPSRYTKEIKQFYDGGDLKRIDVQQNFIKEIISQKANIFYFGKLKDIISVVLSNIETNITLNEALKMSNNISRLDSSKINTLKLPGEPKGDNSGWYFIQNKTESDELIKLYFNSKERFINNINSNTGNTKSNQKTNTVKSSTIKEPSKYDTTTNTNPSNNETSMKGSTTEQP